MGDAGDPYNGLDRFGRVQDQRWMTTATGVSQVRLQYGFTRQSLRKWRHDMVPPSGQDEFYTYDGLSQVKSRDLGTLNLDRSAISGTPAQEEDWTYDPAGNWRNYLVKASGTTTLNQNRIQNMVNEITAFANLSAPVAYDKAGNMTSVPYLPGTSSQHYTLVWDAWNRVKRLVYTPPTPGGSGSSSSSSSSSSSGSGSTGPAGPPLDVIYSYDGFEYRTEDPSSAESEPNGCGSADSEWVPDTFFGEVDFGPACDAHDKCYGTCGSDKSLCDSAVAVDMANACESLSFAARQVCCMQAAIYWKAVDRKGKVPFDDAQDEVCSWAPCCRK